MATVILVRHGRTTANTAGVLAGRSPGVRLDERGREQVARRGERLAGLPLRGIVATPVSIYLGGVQGWELAGVLALQLGWLAVLWWVTDKAWIAAFRAVEVQGG